MSIRAVPPSVAHEARLLTQKMTQKQRSPQGNYDHSEFQWGIVEAINAGPPATVDVYLDGTQTLSDTAYLTKGIRYLASYTPTVGDGVLVHRGSRRSSSDRVVLGKLA